MKLLIVEDDADFSEALQMCLGLHWEAWEVLVARTGREALDSVHQHDPDLLILDLNLPDKDGYTVCREVREISGAPILILTCRTSEMDKVRGLEAGADDYVTKPFGAMELHARMRALLRRMAFQQPASQVPIYTFANLKVDFAGRQVFQGGRRVKLTPTEYGVLYHLIQNAPRVLSHETLLVKVWGSEYRSEKEYVRVHIRHLRQKLRDDAARPHFIATEHGIGYRFVGPAPALSPVGAGSIKA